MLDPKKIDHIYDEFMKNLSKWLPDGITDVDMELLYEYGLMDNLHDDQDDFVQYFHVIETAEKVTLFNEQFIIWIVPKMEEEIPTTYVFIALNNEKDTHLEIVFSTKGVYNTPKYVLKLLQFYLLDMLETEATLTAYENEPN